MRPGTPRKRRRPLEFGPTRPFGPNRPGGSCGPVKRRRPRGPQRPAN